MGCFVGNLTQEMSENSNLIKSSSVSFYSKAVDLIYNNLVEAKNDGEIKTDEDLMTMAGFIISSWQGTILRAKAASLAVLDEFMIILNNVILK